jgi:hypothetical protein
VIPFTRIGGDASASFERAEADILMQLATDVRTLLADIDEVDPGSPSARAIDRLLPSAYGDGGDNDAEYRRFTAEGLVDRKARNARIVIETLETDASAGSVRVNLDAEASQAWLRCLTDIRLTIAAGLGIENDGDELQFIGRDRFVLEVYGWVGFVQESLLSCLSPDAS